MLCKTGFLDQRHFSKQLNILNFALQVKMLHSVSSSVQLVDCKLFDHYGICNNLFVIILHLCELNIQEA